MTLQRLPVQHGNALKNIDFILWRVARAKEDRHRREVTRLLMDRPREADTRH